jgi:hypothetical protein
MGAGSMSIFGKKHLAAVHLMDCGVCGEGPVVAHHILEGRTPGRKSPDELAIPLCHSCHVDPLNGIHGMGAMWKVMKKTELEVLAETYRKIYG